MIEKLKAKWSKFTAWCGRQYRKLSAFVVALLASLGLLTVVQADDVTLTWQNATTYEDGTPIEVGDLVSTEIYYKVRPLETDPDPAVLYELLDTVPATQTTYFHPDLPDGVHCYRAKHLDSDGMRSKFSNETCKEVDTRILGSPQGLTAE